MLQTEAGPVGERILPGAFADGEVDAKTKILIGAAVSMTLGCYP